jgi:hypothetical protein
MGGFSILLVLWGGLLLYQRRNKRCVVVAQLSFLGILLAGALMKAVGALVAGIETSSQHEHSSTDNSLAWVTT